MVAINDWFKLNIRDESHIHESILFGFSGRSNDAIAINYCKLYVKHYRYLEKLNENKNQNTLNIDFFSYKSKLKYILKIEKAYVLTIITVSSLILYITTYRLHACDFLM